MKFLSFVFSLVAFLFASLLVVIPLFKEHLSQVAAETASPLAEMTKTATTSANWDLKQEIDYYLPYPGILPDHPFYWLKMIRDRVSLTFTRDHTARFEKLLLFADKRIGAALALVKGRKFNLGYSTATKAEIYLERALVAFNQLQKENKTNAMLKERMTKAVAKHAEILENLAEIGGERQGDFSKLQEKTLKLLQEIQ